MAKFAKNYFSRKKMTHSSERTRLKFISCGIFFRPLLSDTFRRRNLPRRIECLKQLSLYIGIDNDSRSMTHFIPKLLSNYWTERNRSNSLTPWHQQQLHRESQLEARVGQIRRRRRRPERRHLWSRQFGRSTLPGFKPPTDIYTEKLNFPINYPPIPPAPPTPSSSPYSSSLSLSLFLSFKTSAPSKL